MTRKSNFKTLFGCMLAFVLIISALSPIGLSSIQADSKLTIERLISDHKEQEITSNLDFSTDFGDSDEFENLEEEGWKTPEYEDEDIDFVFEGVKVIDLTSDEELDYGDKKIPHSNIGTDKTENNKYGLLFLTDEQGIAGIESDTFEIPAHAFYVLTFNAKILETIGIGLNVKIIDTKTDRTISMAPIKAKSTVYTTYAFLIRGNEFEDRNVKIQFIWGSVTKDSDGKYSSEKEVGYAALDSLHLFSVNATQYEELASVSANTKADLFTSNPKYMHINNGYFSFSDNRNWNLTTPQSITDLKPSDWTQETAVTKEDSRIAHYGIIDVKSDIFGTRALELGLSHLINPGHITTQENNNVLLIYNKEATWQTIRSNETTLAKSSHYEISFKFNTPALKTLAEEEENSLSFYIVDGNGKTIYSRENIYSYEEWKEGENDWATFRTFIKTPDTDKKVRFIIKFGTEAATQEGYAYVDEVILSKKASQNTMFENSLEDHFILKTEEGAATEYLAKGVVSFSDLLKLDTTNNTNRELSIYDYTNTDGAVEEPKEDDKEETPSGNGANIEYLWYVIPSVLLGLCVIFGLIIFYARKWKSKIKLPKRTKKNSYDRKKTLEKQVSQREKAENKSKLGIEKQLTNVRSRIEKLESNYQKTKSSPLALKEYIKKREKLQNEELKLKTKLKN